MDHRAGHEPRIAEQLRGLAQPPVGERGADRPGRYRTSFVLETRHHVDGEAEFLAFGAKKIRRAGAIGAEMEIKANHRPAHREAIDQDAGDELLGGEVRQCLIECQHNGAVEPG